MDIQLLAQQLVAFLAPFLPYLLKAGEKAAEEAGKKLDGDAWERAKTLWGKLRPKVEAKLAAQEAVKDATAAPQNKDAQTALRLQLKKILAEDDTLATEVARLWEDAKAAGVIVSANGERSVAIGGDASNSTIITGDQNVGHIIITGDILFARFAETSSLTQHIRIREFQTLVSERTREFTGRDFIFKAVDDLLTRPDFPSGYIVISGEPGIGKTALVAQFVKQRGYVHHFNVATQNIRHVRDFLANVCAQLIARYNLEYRTLPDKSTSDSGFLLQLLAESVKVENRPVVILVDALDEAEDTGLPPNINCLCLPQVLPEGVFFIVTTRPKTDYRLLVDRRKDIYLDDKDPNNLADVAQYIQNFIQLNADQMELRIAQWEITKEEFVAVITQKSEGNFMYLTYVLRDIRDGRLTATDVDDIHLLPQGLRAYYQRHWRSMKAQDPEKFETYYQPVVCILAVVREPVAIEQMAEWTKLSLMQVKGVISEWREFLNVDQTQTGEHMYRLYHTSFQEFLRDEVGLKPYHGTIAKTALGKIQW